MRAVPQPRENLLMGIADIGIGGGAISLIQLEFRIFREFRILFKAHDDHHAIAVVSQVDGPTSFDRFFDFRELVPKMGYRSDLNHGIHLSCLYFILVLSEYYLLVNHLMLPQSISLRLISEVFGFWPEKQQHMRYSDGKDATSVESKEQAAGTTLSSRAAICIAKSLS
jgi:hypothetical protein